MGTGFTGVFWRINLGVELDAIARRDHYFAFVEYLGERRGFFSWANPASPDKKRRGAE